MTTGEKAGPRGVVVGAVILIVAVALCWGVVAVGQASGGRIVALLGQERVTNSPALFETVFTALVFGALIVAAVVGAAIDRRNAFAGGRRPLSMLIVGLLIGFAGLSVSAGFARFAGGISTEAPPSSAPSMLAWGLGIVAVQVIAEEVYFRGWLQPALARRWGTLAAVTMGAVAFAVLHVAGGTRAHISLLTLFLGGLMFGLLAAHGGGIAAAVGAHLAWNGSEQLLYGLDPNGADDQWIGSFGAVLNWDARGSAIWGGSPDGLNGSIGMVVALLAILVPLFVLTLRGRASPAKPAFGAA